VIYFNQYGYPPTIKEIWLDENLDGLFEEEEKYVMEDIDPIDMDYTDGKEYIKTIQYIGEGTGFVTYKFVFSDIYMLATGPPTQEGFSIQIFSDSNSQVGNNNPSGRDQLSWEGLETEGAKCFIQSLLYNIPISVKQENDLDNMQMKTGTPSIKVWLKIFKFGLLTLLIMAFICFLMFGYSILRGGWSIPKKL
jgi:hypothetical protein